MQLRVTTRNLEQANAELRALAARIQDWRPVLAQFGVHMLRNVEKTFEAGGRPTAWPPSVRVRRKGGKTLINTARLKNSIVTALLNMRTLQLGTNLPYAAVHQFGFSGTVQIPQHLRRVRTRDIRAGGKPRGKLQATGFAVVKAHPAHMRIPARPYLVVQDEDLTTLVAMAERHVEPK